MLKGKRKRICSFLKEETAFPHQDQVLLKHLINSWEKILELFRPF